MSAIHSLLVQNEWTRRECRYMYIFLFRAFPAHIREEFLDRLKEEGWNSNHDHTFDRVVRGIINQTDDPYLTPLEGYADQFGVPIVCWDPSLQKHTDLSALFRFGPVRSLKSRIPLRNQTPNHYIHCYFAQQWLQMVYCLVNGLDPTRIVCRSKYEQYVFRHITHETLSTYVPKQPTITDADTQASWIVPEEF